MSRKNIHVSLDQSLIDRVDKVVVDLQKALGVATTRSAVIESVLVGRKSLVELERDAKKRKS